MRFNCVLANPPFGQEKWGADAFESDKYGRNIWGCPSDSNADYAWLQHMVKSMKPMEGKVAVVLPQGVLFHSGKEEKDIKEVYDLYQGYEDVIEKCKIVTIDDLDAAGNTLAVNTYIEKKKQEIVSPAVVRAQYFEALENVRKAEAKMKALLIEGGYVNEQ